MVKKGEDFVVFDAKTGEEITRSVLAQIIFEQEGKTGQSLLPITFLRQLIRFYGDSMQMLVPSYLEFTIDKLTSEQHKLRDADGNGLRRQDSFPGRLCAAQMFDQLEEQTRKNMLMFSQALSMFNPFAAAQAERTAPPVRPDLVDDSGAGGRGRHRDRAPRHAGPAAPARPAAPTEGVTLNPAVRARPRIGSSTKQAGPVPESSRFEHPAFRLFWAGRTLSSLAFQMSAVAVGWLVYARTGSAASLGLVGLFQFLPMVCLTLLVGHVADRYDRRRIVAICQAIEGVTLLGLASGPRRVSSTSRASTSRSWCSGAARAFESPTLSALLPGTVPSEPAAAGGRALVDGDADRHDRRAGARRAALRARACGALRGGGRVLSRRERLHRRNPARAGAAAPRTRDAASPCSPAWPSSGAARSCSAPSRSTSWPCCSAAPPRCCRSTPATCCTPAPGAWACCGPRPPSGLSPWARPWRISRCGGSVGLKMFGAVLVFGAATADVRALHHICRCRSSRSRCSAPPTTSAW